MARLDVSEVLLDPDFMDTSLVCERNAQTVGSNGLAVNTTTLTPFAGVVTTDNGDIMERIQSGERVKGSITIYTRFQLHDGAAGEAADVIQWRGRRYTASSVMDFLNFGTGFVRADCDLIPFTG